MKLMREKVIASLRDPMMGIGEMVGAILEFPM